MVLLEAHDPILYMEEHYFFKNVNIRVKLSFRAQSIEFSYASFLLHLIKMSILHADLIFVETHNNGPQVLAGFTGFAEEQDWIHGYIMQFSSIFKLFLCMPFIHIYDTN
ncbi:hypothetical protein ACJX0J_008163 [Zea mays]